AKFMSWGKYTDRLSRFPHVSNDARLGQEKNKNLSSSLSELRHQAQEDASRGASPHFDSFESGKAPRDQKFSSNSPIAPDFVGMPTMTDIGGFQVFSLGAAHGAGVTRRRPATAKAMAGKQGYGGQGGKLTKFSKSVFLYEDSDGDAGVEIASAS